MNAKEAKANSIFHLKKKHPKTVAAIDSKIHSATIEGKTSIVLNKVNPDEATDIISIYRMQDYVIQSSYWSEYVGKEKLVHVWLSINW